MKEDKILLANIEDKIVQCTHRSMLTYSNFLDMRQQSMVENKCKSTKGLNYQFLGGYPDAERKIVAFFPDYPVEESPLSAIRVTVKTGGKKLAHGDYLGSLTGLGVKREVLGDLLVRDDGCDIILLNEVVDFFLYNYGKAGRANLNVEQIGLEDLLVPQGRFEEKQDTVASLRLDNVVASAFATSRSNAASCIQQGLVYINGIQSEKVDKLVCEGDKLVLRGKGKIRLKAVGRTTRKNKIVILMDRYI